MEQGSVSIRADYQSKYWMFTIFPRQSDVDQDDVYLLDLDDDRIQYLVYQLEMCPETSRLHYQGYVEFKTKQRMATVKHALMDPSVHLEPRRGTQQDAIDYCTKLDSRIDGPWFHGLRTPNEQGKRNDMAEIRDRIKTGATNIEIIDSYPGQFVRYFRGLSAMRAACTTQRNWTMDVIVCVGGTGTGKSRYAYELDNSAYWKQRSRWWCGLEFQHTVVIDDFYGWLPYDEILRLTDRYPCQVETKGSSVQFVSKRIVFTSNLTPDRWWKRDAIVSNLAAFYRRVTEWRLFLPDQSVKVFDNYDDFSAEYVIHYN